MIPTTPQAAAFRANLEPQAIIRRRDNIILDVSRGWLSRFGVTYADVIGRTIRELGIFAEPDGHGRFEALLARPDDTRELEIALQNGAGAVTPGAVAVVPLAADNEACWLVVVRDKSAKMPGLAHELNQPLTAIMANALAGLRFMERDPIDTAELRSLLEDIVADNRRAAEISVRLRAFLEPRDE